MPIIFGPVLVTVYEVCWLSQQFIAQTKQEYTFIVFFLKNGKQQETMTDALN